MTLAETPSGSPTDVMLRLRKETAGSHARLEKALALLDPPLARERFVTLLERFYGFHAVWEPVIAPHFDPDFLQPRRRIRLIEADLIALGHHPADTKPPFCFGAAALGRSPEAALGSLYVLEGSTLGGQVIARGLQGTGWGERIRYFNPYGEGTGTMWSALKTLVRTRSGTSSDPKIMAGALATFDLLQDWLSPAFPEPA